MRAADVTEIVLVRHGETEWNRVRRIQGQLDVELNALGLAQAQSTGQRLADRDLAAIYSSDLMRARQTAAALAAGRGLEIVLERRLRERHYGAFEGRYYDDLRRDEPARHARLMSRELDFDLDGGETIVAFNARCCAVLAEIAPRHRGQRIAVVTHGGVLDCAYRLATGVALDAPRTFELPNAAINIVDFDGARFEVRQWAMVGHLTAARDENH